MWRSEHMWRSEDDMWRLFWSSSIVGPRAPSQVVSLWLAPQPAVPFLQPQTDRDQLSFTAEETRAQRSDLSKAPHLQVAQ